MMDDQTYVKRLMRARCSEGTMSNYLNVDVDHGIVVGADMQPLMNANDHVAGKHIIHFGNCKSDHNPDLSLRKSLLRVQYSYSAPGKVIGLIAGDKNFVGDKITSILEDFGILSCKCKPNTPNPWECTNEDNIVEGAPALMLGSKLTCRYGGCIELLPEEEYPPEELVPKTEEETSDDAPAYADACESVKTVLNNAMTKISETGSAGEQAVQQTRIALLIAAVMSVCPKFMLHSRKEEQGFPTGSDNFSLEYIYPANEQEREQNYEHNKSLEPSLKAYTNEEGLIINQGGMRDYHINNMSVERAGCGAIALYNVAKILNPEAQMTFSDVVYHTESYGLFGNTLGIFPTGVSDSLNKLGYDTQYVLNPQEQVDVIAESDAAIVLYAANSNTGGLYAHYTALQPVSDGDITHIKNQKFHFYNEEQGKENDMRTYKEFTTKLNTDQTLIAQIVITAKKREDEGND